MPTDTNTSPPRKIAAIGTIYFRNSHMDVIVSKFLEGCDHPYFPFEPQVAVAAMYLDQGSTDDLGLHYARRFNVPIFADVAEALTLGTDRLAVDGVLLIGEHGQYPTNRYGQIEYPRKRLFDEIAATFERTGQAVPVFVDKHLSYRWEDALEMYETSKRLGFPMMAGSSVPYAHRRPEGIVVSPGAELEEIVGVAYGPVETYGFHALEMTQSVAELRAGGETGVRSVQCLSGRDVWQAAEKGLWSESLMEAAVRTARLRRCGDIRNAPGQVTLFLVDHNDGFRTRVLLAPEYMQDFCAAWRCQDGRRQATCFYLLPGPPYAHFAALDAAIQQMVVTGAPTVPVERTLLTTGVLDRLMKSRYCGGRRIETPELTDRGDYRQVGGHRPSES